MKKNLLKYYILLSLLILFGLHIYFDYTNFSVYSDYSSVIDSCDEYLNFDDYQREKFDNQFPNLYTINQCEYIVKKEGKPLSFFFVYSNLLSSTVFQFIFPFFVPLFILFPLIYKLSLEFNSNYIKYYLLRNSYKNYIKNLFMKSYKYACIVISIIILFVILSFVKSNFNFDSTMDYYLSYIGDDYFIFNNKWNYLIYFLIIILNLFTYINISLFVLRGKNRNFLICLTESFLIIYLWWCFTFVIVGNLFQKFFGIASERINLLEIYTWHEIDNGKLFLIVNIVYYLITLFIVLLSYKNKEKFIMRCEG